MFVVLCSFGGEACLLQKLMHHANLGILFVPLHVLSIDGTLNTNCAPRRASLSLRLLFFSSWTRSELNPPGAPTRSV